MKSKVFLEIDGKDSHIFDIIGEAFEIKLSLTEENPDMSYIEWRTDDGHQVKLKLVKA